MPTINGCAGREMHRPPTAVQGLLAGESFDEMKIADVHALAEVKTVGLRPMGAGIEVQLSAALLSGEVAYPGEEVVAVAS